MREARDHYEKGNAQGALEALSRAERTKGNERVVVVQIYRLRGQAAALADKPRESLDAFGRYLALEPAADGTGIREEALPLFQKAKVYWKDREPLKIEHLPPGKVPPGRKVSIPIRVASDPAKMIARRELRYRRQGDKEWKVVMLGAGNESADLPPMPVPLAGDDYRIEYYIVAVNEHEGVLDTLGAPSAPLAFLVTESAIVRPPPWYKKWWVWAAAGAVAAGSVAAYAIISDDGLPDLEPVSNLGARR